MPATDMARLAHPIDAEIRAWLKRHVPNKAELSKAVGHSGSWLHKLTNGVGHATIDDYVRMAGVLMGLDLPVLTPIEQKILKSVRCLEEADLLDVMAYADHRGRIARRGPSKESSAPAAHSHPVKVNTGRGTP
jgi:hypothetical protein